MIHSSMNVFSFGNFGFGDLMIPQKIHLWTFYFIELTLIIFCRCYTGIISHHIRKCFYLNFIFNLTQFHKYRPVQTVFLLRYHLSSSLTSTLIPCSHTFFKNMTTFISFIYLSYSMRSILIIFAVFRCCW